MFGPLLKVAPPTVSEAAAAIQANRFDLVQVHVRREAGDIHLVWLDRHNRAAFSDCASSREAIDPGVRPLCHGSVSGLERA